MQVTIHPFPIATGAWEEAYNKPLAERGEYSSTGDTLSFTQVSGMIMGTPWDEFTYKEYLYNMAYDRADVHVFTTRTFDKQIEEGRRQGVQELISFHRDNQKMSLNRFMAFVEGKSLIPLKGEPYYDHIRAGFVAFLKEFEQLHGGLYHNDLNRVLTDNVKWSWTYLKPWVEASDYQKQAIRVIWYGDATKSEIYFLRFLMLLGVDVLAFHPEGKNIFAVHLAGLNIPARNYVNTLPYEPLSTSKPMREATVAARASAELEQMFQAGGVYTFTPWQFRDHSPQSITLHTTIDEVRLISEARAFIRPSFEVKNKIVYVPVLFSKICGISKDRLSYAQRYAALVASELTIAVNQFPFTTEVRGYHRFHYDQSLTRGEMDANKIISAEWWKYSHLPRGLQLGLAGAISRYVSKASLKPLPGEDIQIYLFSQALELPPTLLQLLQKFDYAQIVPTLLIFNDGKSGMFSRSDIARILLLNELGMDVLLYNPTGQQDLELHIDTKLFDTHWLEDVCFEQNHQLQLDLACGKTRTKKAVKGFINKIFN